MLALANMARCNSTHTGHRRAAAVRSGAISTPLFCSQATIPPAHLLFLAKHLFEKGRRLRCGVGADLLFLLPQFVEQAIEGLTDHIAI